MITQSKNAARGGAVVLGMAMALGASPSWAQDGYRVDRLIVIGDSLSDGGAYTQASIASALLSAGVNTDFGINYRFTDNSPNPAAPTVTYAEHLAGLLGVPLDPNIINGVPALANLGALGIPTEAELAGLVAINVLTQMEADAILSIEDIEAINPDYLDLVTDVAIGGTNYAQGGSIVGSTPGGIGHNPLFGFTTLSIVEQVDLMLSETGSLNENDLVILWGGANDVLTGGGAVLLGADAGATEAGIRASADLLAEQVDRIAAAGPATIIVVSIPDVGRTPLGQSGGAAVYTSLTDAYNEELFGALAGKSAVIVDSQQILNALLADPERYGFDSNVFGTACGAGNSIFCVRGVNTVDSASGLPFIFADGVHPTAEAHALFGEAAFAGLRAATQFGALAVAPLNAIQLQSKSVEARLRPTALITIDQETGMRRLRMPGEVEVYAGGEVGFYSGEAQQVLPGLDATTQVLRFGADVVVTEGVLLGVGGSIDFGQVEFDDNAGGFDSRLAIGAIFGMVSLTDEIYLNAAMGAGLIDYADIERRFTLGASQESYSSETDGSYFFWRIGGGALVPVSDELMFNPSVSYTQERISVDGYTEEAAAASLSYGDTEYETQRLSVGLNVIWTPEAAPGWAFSLEGSYEHDFSDENIAVALGPNEDLLSTVYAPRPDDSYGIIGARAAYAVSESSLLAISGSTTIGQDGVAAMTGSLSFTLAF